MSSEVRLGTYRRPKWGVALWLTRPMKSSESAAGAEFALKNVSLIRVTYLSVNWRKPRPFWRSLGFSYTFLKALRMFPVSWIDGSNKIWPSVQMINEPHDQCQSLPYIWLDSEIWNTYFGYIITCLCFKLYFQVFVHLSYFQCGLKTFEPYCIYYTHTHIQEMCFLCHLSTSYHFSRLNVTTK